MSAVLGHLYICETEGYIPFIDMQTYPGTYSEQFPILGTSNMWEYYYLPVSEISIERAYENNDWIDSKGRFPHEIMNSLFSGTTWILGVIDKYIRMRDETSQFLNSARSTMGISRETLGVHFRGKEMRNAPFHPMPPTESQVFRRIDHALDHLGFEHIYLVSEGEEYVESFSRRYGDRLSYLDVARSGKSNAYHQYPRPMHRYMLGLEILTETHLLSDCGGLISGYSGVSEMADVLSRGKYRYVDKIWNGRVRGGRLGAKYLWSYRSRMPRLGGGFKK